MLAGLSEQMGEIGAMQNRLSIAASYNLAARESFSEVASKLWMLILLQTQLCWLTEGFFSGGFSSRSGSGESAAATCAAAA